jgi:hypothetical protein
VNQQRAPSYVRSTVDGMTGAPWARTASASSASSSSRVSSASTVGANRLRDLDCLPFALSVPCTEASVVTSRLWLSVDGVFNGFDRVLYRVLRVVDDAALPAFSTIHSHLTFVCAFIAWEPACSPRRGGRP